MAAADDNTNSRMSKMRKSLTYGLGRRMTVYFGLMIGAFVSTLIYLNTITQLELVHTRFSERSDSLGILIQEVTLPYLFEGRPAELDIIYQELMRQPDILALRFIDPEGFLLVNGSSEGNALFLGRVEDPLVTEAVASETTHIRNLEGRIQVAVPAIYGNVNYGTIRFDLDGTAANREVNLVLRRNLMFGVFFTLTGILLSIWISRRLTEPLARLNSATERAAKGNLNQSIVIRTNDEVESLADSFNLMLGNLRAWVKSLEDTQTKLEISSDDLNAKNAELQVVAEQAKTAERAKSQFLARMSHEIRTPMNGVLGMTELLSDTDLTANQLGLVDSIHTSGTTLLNIINDILDFSKIDSGHMTLRDEPYRPLELVENTAQMLSYQAGQAGVDLITRVEPDLPKSLLGDESRLKQVIINLVGNALKFTEEGYVLINTTLKDENGKPFMQVDVCDTGCGIPEEKLATVFDQFTQVDGSYSRKHQGTGLGLAIAKGFVELMGGRIWVKSTVGTGTTFTFNVPLVQPDTPLPSLPIDGASLNDMKVMVLQSEPTALFVMNEVMSSWHGQVTTFESANEALKSLREAATNGVPYDVVLTEMGLPDMDREDLFRAIHHIKGDTHTRVIALRPMDDAIHQNGSEHDFTDSEVIKPVQTAKLLEALTTPHKANTRRKTDLEIHDNQPANGTAQKRVATELTKPVSDKTILIVDDNKTNRKLIEIFLNRLGVTHHSASDGEQAVECYRDVHPDLVLMDVSMPVMNGLDATREIRRLEGANGDFRTHIIGLTAHSAPEDRAACLDSGMNAHMAKPIKLSQLKDVISQL
ncbi:MAG: response regulator [Shimia sp.]|uniref:hybrid sensor histidine kinase/response regulator n=1 Tax=Shimia sp. TaxID=1954381 RepID=UPI0025EC8BF4|nr:response regulator [Shimia sp.]MCH2066985.1 response regulator [Shimia sp.]